MASFAPRIGTQQMDHPPARLVALMSEHDLATAGDVEAALLEAVESGEPVVVDLRQATVMDSSILSVLFEAQRRARTPGFAVVLASDGEVARLFRLVGGRASFDTFASVDHAVAWCYPAASA